MSSKAPSRSEPSSQGRSPIQARGGAPAPAPARPRRIVLRILTRAQDISALALGSFLVVHLAAPLSALVVGQGAETASKTMVLGRVYYQSTLGEPLVVWGALGVHVLSSTARRLLQTFWPASSSTSTPSPNSISSLTTPPLPATHTTSSTSPSNQTDWFRVRIRLTSLSLHALTGYLLIPTVWIHAMVHRIVPSRSSPPIRNLSPSELDYSFVSYGIARYPFTSTLVFGTLIGAASWHAIEGARKVYLRSGPGSLSLWKKTTGKTSTSAVTQNSPNPEALRPSAPSRANGKRARRQAATVAGSATGLLIAALYRIGAEGDAAVPAWLARRYEACYALVWPYSMTR